MQGPTHESAVPACCAGMGFTGAWYRARKAVALGCLLVTLTAPAGAEESTVDATKPAPGLELAIFAGGCFWCVEADFDHVPGVKRTVSGYTGGHLENPTYKQVTYGDTGHREAVAIHFDPATVSYANLLEVFWRSVDPTDRGGQFCDRGESYTTAIFAISDAQLETAEAAKQALAEGGKLGAPVATPVEMAGPFYAAEEYHQNYYARNPLRYNFYRHGCGRDARLEYLWGEEAMRGIMKK